MRVRGRLHNVRISDLCSKIPAASEYATNGTNFYISHLLIDLKFRILTYIQDFLHNPTPLQNFDVILIIIHNFDFL